MRNRKIEIIKITNFLVILLAVVLVSCDMSSSDSSSSEQEKSTDKVEKTKTVVERTPGFPGGKEKMVEFIQNNLVYPAEAKSNEIEGMVVISFSVDVDGDLINEKVIKGIGYGCDEAALNVVKSMPKWDAAIVDGENKEVKISLPIQFSLDVEK